MSDRGHTKNSPEFYAQILRGIGAPVTQKNLRVLDAWQRAEGSTSSWNPFNSTQSSHVAGETNYNSVGVKNYPSEMAGVNATIATLKNGYYNPMIAALKNDNPEAFIAAVVASPWDGGYGGRGSGKTYKNSSVYRLYIQGGGATLNTRGANTSATTTPAGTGAVGGGFANWGTGTGIGSNGRVTANTTAGPQVVRDSGLGFTYDPNAPIGVANPLSGFESVGQFFRIISNGAFWVRVLEMAFGGLLVAWGIYMLTTGGSGAELLNPAAKFGKLG